MKNSLLFTTVFSLVALFSCSRSPLEYPLEVSAPNDIPAEGGKVTFNIETKENWTITAAADWYELSQTDGKGVTAITVTAKANNTTDRRQDILTVKSGTNFKSVILTQNPIYLDATTPAAILSCETEATFHIASNMEWTIEPAQNDWITKIEPVSGSGNHDVTVMVVENPHHDDRTSILTIKAGDLRKSVTIAQLGKVDEATCPLPIPCDGGSTTFEIKSTTNWTIGTPDSWITSVEPTSGTGDRTITVTAPKNEGNERQCVLSIEFGESKIKREVGIIQRGKSIVNDLVGQYGVVENFHFIDEEGTERWVAWGVFEKLTITRISDTEIRISGLFAGYLENYDSGFSITATVNNDARTLSIPCQKVLPNMMDDQNDSYFVGGLKNNSDYQSPAAGEITIGDEGVSIKIRAYSEKSWEESRASFHLCAIEKSSGENKGWEYYTSQTEWTKLPSRASAATHPVYNASRTRDVMHGFACKEKVSRKHLRH